MQTEVKTEARDRDPNVLQLPEPTSLNPAEQPPCMLAPLVRSGVTYRIYTGNVYSELRKADCVAVFTCIFGFLQGTVQGTDIGTALSSNISLLTVNSINFGPHLNSMPHMTWHNSAALIYKNWDIF